MHPKFKLGDIVQSDPKEKFWHSGKYGVVVAPNLPDKYKNSGVTIKFNFGSSEEECWNFVSESHHPGDQEDIVLLIKKNSSLSEFLRDSQSKV